MFHKYFFLNIFLIINSVIDLAFFIWRERKKEINFFSVIFMINIIIIFVYFIN